MIPEQSYPELGKLINSVPEIFSNSEIIGVFMGNELCASIMHNASKLENIKFYENLSFTDDDLLKDKFLKMYKEWETEIPNLEVLITDGRNFNTSGSFIYHDMDMSPETFFINYGRQLRNSLLANCGFGLRLDTTIEFSLLVHRKLIFPVLLYRDIIFYTTNYDLYFIYLNILTTAIKNANLDFEIYKGSHDNNVIRILTTQSYIERAETLK